MELHSIENCFIEKDGVEICVILLNCVFVILNHANVLNTNVITYTNALSLACIWIGWACYSLKTVFCAYMRNMLYSKVKIGITIILFKLKPFKFLFAVC